ncbi:helix-turn-helix domain-containing protein [Streptomyces sp. NBC_01744]|uniref:helix-turn-helix domain-containing protein n=1 Tax=Streptomyces sp. NBC_01744 TaxID=2975927 RepID=UPI003D9A7419|nr:helix-turn-helix domain-containing protein [Streptomyces sp. NBC_01744]
MISADEIAAALDGTVSNLAVARELGVAPERVRRVRAKEGVPVYPRGRRGSGESWAEAFAARTLAVDGGHLDWTGSVSEHGTPVLRVRRETETAYRYAFRVHHGREAQGNSGPVCGFPRCVAGAHLEDRVLREERLAKEERPRVRGRMDPPAGATWHRDVDLIAVERFMRGVPPVPELTEDEQRYAAVLMTQAGVGGEEIAQRLGVAARTVTRWRLDAGLSDERP